jgi:hypothetical protein
MNRRSLALLLAAPVLAAIAALAVMAGLPALESGAATPSAAMAPIPDPPTPDLSVSTALTGTGCNATFTWGNAGGYDMRYAVTDFDPAGSGNAWQDSETSTSVEKVTIPMTTGQQLWVTATRVRHDGARSGSATVDATC